MILFRTVTLVLAVIPTACTQTAPATRSLICKRLAITKPSVNSAKLTFRRSDSVAIEVHLAWEPSPDPIYSPRGAMTQITVSEAGRGVFVAPRTIHDLHVLRSIEDLWPESVELRSARPGDYDLLLPHGVPAGMGATLVELRGYAFHSAVSLVSPRLLESYQKHSQGPEQAQQRLTAPSVALAAFGRRTAATEQSEDQSPQPLCFASFKTD
jgi:hypothetical protein